MMMPLQPLVEVDDDDATSAPEFWLKMMMMSLQPLVEDDVDVTSTSC
jgi:hypothetical protein